MEIDVALADASDPWVLARRLAAAVDSIVSVDIGGEEIRVRMGVESPRTVLRVVDVVEGWLEQGSAESARLSLGGRSCMLTGGRHLPSQ